MNNYIFLFDLDSTITNEEILPTIAKTINAHSYMADITEKAMNGEVPFKTSFLQRVELLKDIPVSEVQGIVLNIKLNEEILNFINKNKENCYIVTGNLDAWILPLMKKIGMENHYYSSKAEIAGDKLNKIISIIDKGNIAEKFSLPIAAIGDGDNDIAMMEKANISIAYGGVRKLSPAVINCADYVFYDEKTLCKFLEKL